MLCEVYLKTRGGKTAVKYSRVLLPTGCARSWCMDGPHVYLLDAQVESIKMPKLYWTSITEWRMEDVQPGSIYIMIRITYTH